MDSNLTLDQTNEKHTQKTFLWVCISLPIRHLECFRWYKKTLIELFTLIQAELRRRERGHAVRLEVSGEIPQDALEWLSEELGIDPARDLYHSSGPLVIENFNVLTKHDGRTELYDPPFSPLYVPPLRDSEDFFATIKKRDIKASPHVCSVTKLAP